MTSICAFIRFVHSLALAHPTPTSKCIHIRFLSNQKEATLQTNLIKPQLKLVNRHAFWAIYANMKYSSDQREREVFPFSFPTRCMLNKLIMICRARNLYYIFHSRNFCKSKQQATLASREAGNSDYRFASLCSRMVFLAFVSEEPSILWHDMICLIQSSPQPPIQVIPVTEPDSESEPEPWQPGPAPKRVGIIVRGASHDDRQ